jgi:penicillin-binding protein 1A
VDKSLPSLEVLETYSTSLITKVYSADHELLQEFYIQRRELVPLERIPTHLIDALTSSEDKKFMRHWGVDWVRIPKALYVNFRKGYRAQGASTVTQQLARMLHLHQEKTWDRKIREAFTALKIERTYSKDEILQMYLNESYFGHGRHGVQAAAQYYFSKNVEDLTVSESATLIGILPAPARYSPLFYPDKCIVRRNLVLNAMVRNRRLDKTVADSLKKSPLVTNVNTGAIGTAPYFVEHIRRILEKDYGVDILYKKGVSVYTTLDSKLQEYAEKAVKKQLLNLQNIVDDKKEKPYKTYEEIDSLDTKPVQVAFMALDPKTGHIKAMVGGRNFEKSSFNRATQAQRQPGSAFKPFVYTAAVDNGYTPVYTLIDNPIVIPMPDGTEWRPKNYGREFQGPMMIRDGLRLSVNLISIKLLQQVGPKQVIKYARRMGIQSPLMPVLSMGVGSAGEVNLMEMVNAYGVFANRGIRVRPMPITEIRDQDGNVYKKFHPYSEVALREETAYLMAHMLQGVVNAGTGADARREGFKRPAGGKTGTTDGYTDAWFIGFTPQLVTGVWVGFDDNTPLGHWLTGSDAALPIWTKFMIAAHDSMGLPVKYFYKPSRIIRERICKDTQLKATEYCPHVIEEEFISGTEPRSTCAMHAGLRKSLDIERGGPSVVDSLRKKRLKRQGLQF